MTTACRVNYRESNEQEVYELQDNSDGLVLEHRISIGRGIYFCAFKRCTYANTQNLATYFGIQYGNKQTDWLVNEWTTSSDLLKQMHVSGIVSFVHPRIEIHTRESCRVFYSAFRGLNTYRTIPGSLQHPWEMSKEQQCLQTFEWIVKDHIDKGVPIIISNPVHTGFPSVDNIFEYTTFWAGVCVYIVHATSGLVRTVYIGTDGTLCIGDAPVDADQISILSVCPKLMYLYQSSDDVDAYKCYDTMSREPQPDTIIHKARSYMRCLHPTHRDAKKVRDLVERLPFIGVDE